MGYVFLGGMILWLGWFGFNPGSTMAADPDAIARIAVTTNLAAAAGTIISTFYAWWRHGKPDFSLTVNGCLAGLVAITAPCAFVTPLAVHHHRGHRGRARHRGGRSCSTSCGSTTRSAPPRSTW